MCLWFEASGCAPFIMFHFVNVILNVASGAENRLHASKTDSLLFFTLFCTLYLVWNQKKIGSLDSYVVLLKNLTYLHFFVLKELNIPNYEYFLTVFFSFLLTWVCQVLYVH